MLKGPGPTTQDNGPLSQRAMHHTFLSYQYNVTILQHIQFTIYYLRICEKLRLQYLSAKVHYLSAY